MEPGRLLASGRDSEIFEAGAGKVLRRARDGRSLEGEAAVMAHVHGQGFPSPEVFDVSEDGTDILMERVDGPTMLDDLVRRPWRLRRHAASLAELHRQLHDMEAPSGLRVAPGSPGDRLLHLDLHPLNVLISERGPVLIDWSNASCGHPAVDVAATWILLVGGDPPAGSLKAKLLKAGRGAAVGSFLGHFELAEVRRELPAVAEWKSRDPNMAAHEVARIRQLAAQEGLPQDLP